MKGCESVEVFSGSADDVHVVPPLCHVLQLAGQECERHGDRGYVDETPSLARFGGTLRAQLANDASRRCGGRVRISLRYHSTNRSMPATISNWGS